MKDFLKFMLASMAGYLLISIILLLIFMIFLFSLASLGEKEAVVVPGNAVLQLTLDKKIMDRGTKTPQMSNFTDFSMEKTPGLDDILACIKKAGEDDHIKGIYLDLNNLNAGIANIDEFRTGLINFRKSGKFIYSYADSYSQGSYYLATAGDKIYMHPKGMMLFKGLYAEVTFYKNTLEKLDVEAQLIRPMNNRFKSAMEPFISDRMSDANREQTSRFITTMWDYMIGQIATARNLPVSELNRIATELDALKKPELAVEKKLIDGLLYKDEFMAEIRKALDIKEEKKIPSITLNKYMDYEPHKKQKVFQKNKIAVIYALGGISGGEGDDYAIGSERLSKTIREARLDTNVRAIVLRVNSPGGDALASDVILRELMLAKFKKPVVASYGDVAASGGYWISCMADKIVAHENTITGSIGVFGFVPNMEGLFTNKLGLTFDQVETNANAEFMAINRPMTEKEKEVLQYEVDDIYATFLAYVAEARNIPVERVDSIAQGRVWSGVDAKRIGLIDEFGGLDDAIQLASEMAEITNYKVVSLPKQKDPFQQIMDELMGKDPETRIQKEIGDFYPYYRIWKEISTMKGVQARLPYELQIQ
ncbi:MAG: signal peptide peptidase SppA [Bacteroidales bacterium]|nr:signal peptide peptidase SppA [Lentimicrobiaceae bacterium]MDD5694199.1 signal peptide peptidase SppA [Bacteroidales bacterium]